MLNRPPQRRFTLADIMILVASVAGLLAVIHPYGIVARMGPITAGFQAAFTSAALFLSLGGFGACTARWRGRPRFEGFCWGFICGPFGLLMLALMPYPPED
jgi:hypothetical protein